MSAATHRNELRAARSLWGWLVKRGWAVMNPWAEVEPVGRVRAGKEQLRAREARALDAVALEQAQGMGTGSPRWAESRQEGALAVLVALYLGLRAGEIVGLLARDVGAGELFVADGKTSNAVRRVGVPESLASLLEAHAARVRARGGDRLFAHRPEWVRDNTRRLCRAAGVPEVCAHSLRGLHATLATEAGATAEAVAAQLGHGSTEVTAAHYTRAEATEAARQRAVMRTLQNGREGGSRAREASEGQGGAGGQGVAEDVAGAQGVPEGQGVVEGQGVAGAQGVAEAGAQDAVREQAQGEAQGVAGAQEEIGAREQAGAPSVAGAQAEARAREEKKPGQDSAENLDQAHSKAAHEPADPPKSPVISRVRRGGLEPPQVTPLDP